MMSQSSLFAEEPFFSWEQNYQPLSSLHQHFFKHRTKLADVLLKELHEGSEMAKPSRLPLEPSKHNSKDQQKEAVSPHLHGVTNHNNGDLLVTLDARGYAPSDITVKLEGRTLAVVAMKQAGAEESQSSSSSSSSSCASLCSSASSQTGFVQRIDLPPYLDLPRLSCNLMDNGQLCIHAPAAKQPIEEEVPIRFKTSLEFPITKDKTEEVNTN